MFLVAAERNAAVATALWPYATQEPFLVSPDTAKDAFDLIAAHYPAVEAAGRSEFEQKVLAVRFPQATDPDRARARFLERFFDAIGADHLATLEARTIVAAMAPTQTQRANPRPYTLTTSVGRPDDHWWLREAGVDLEAPANVALLTATEDASARLHLDNQESAGDLRAAISELKTLENAIRNGGEQQADSRVVEYSEQRLGRGCEKISYQTEELRENDDLLDAMCEIVEPLLRSRSPEVADDTEAKHDPTISSSSGARVVAAEAAINLCRAGSRTAARMAPRLRELADDRHPDVRLAIAAGLGALWNSDREEMWRLAEAIARNELNQRVLAFFAGFLTGAIHADSGRVEELVLAILPRVRNDRPGNELAGAIGNLVTLLWVSHARPAAKSLLDQWLANRDRRDSELSHAVLSIREGLVLGYGSQSESDRLIRERCQAFAAHIVSVSADAMERYFSLAQAERTDAENQHVSVCIQLLDQTGDQYYFASGAFSHGQATTAIATIAAKRQFLADNKETFHRIGSVAPPHTIFNLLELLDFLSPANPVDVFDLVAHALMNAGRQHGFQFESLGSDQFVKIIGRFLADHREAFADEKRRKSLVECLDIFVDVGWPPARRLLYRLPELLQ